MGRYDGLFLYCDMDGTLLDDQKRISAENLAAIERFVAQGGRFGVATGRTPMNVDYYADLLPINAPCILYNGAAVYDLRAHRFLATHPLDRASAIELASRALALHEDVCIQIFTADAIYEPNPRQLDDPLTVMEHMDRKCVPLEQIPGDWLKLILCRPADRLGPLCEALELGQYASRFSMFRSAPVYQEFVAYGVSKGRALDDIRNAAALEVRSILAMGDYSNDLDLIRMADVGGAPANALPEIRAAATVPLDADNNHSAVAAFLRRAL